MSTADGGQHRQITVHEFVQRFRQAIGLQGIAVYKLIYRYHVEYGCAYPTQQTIADELGCSRETVNRAIRRLLAQDLLHKQPVMVQGRSVVAYHPLIDLSDILSQGSDQEAHGCARLSQIGAMVSPPNDALHENQATQTSDHPSLVNDHSSHDRAFPSQECGPLSHDLEEEDQDISIDQEIDLHLQIIAENFYNDHERDLLPNERAVFVEILTQDGPNRAEQVLERLRRQSWRSPNYIRTVWHDCQQMAAVTAMAPKTTVRRRRELPPEYADIILR